MYILSKDKRMIVNTEQCDTISTEIWGRDRMCNIVAYRGDSRTVLRTYGTESEAIEEILRIFTAISAGKQTYCLSDGIAT